MIMDTGGIRTLSHSVANQILFHLSYGPMIGAAGGIEPPPKDSQSLMLIHYTTQPIFFKLKVIDQPAFYKKLIEVREGLL